MNIIHTITLAVVPTEISLEHLQIKILYSYHYYNSFNKWYENDF
jgi:hypothetical protein